MDLGNYRAARSADLLSLSRLSRMTICLLGLSMLAGCTTGWREYISNGFKVGPNYRTPAARVSPEWIDQRDKRLNGEPVDYASWWRLFNDPDLDRLVQTAHAQNLTLREAGFRVLEARALLGYSIGNLFPQSQTAFGSYSRTQRSLESLAGIGGGGAFTIPRNFDIWSGGARLAWELDFWGRFRRSIEAASAELDAQVENYDDVLVLLVADVATVYVEIRTLEQRIRYAQSNARYQTFSLELAETKRQEGVASKLDVAEATTNLAQTEATIPQLQARLRLARNRLCVLMGIPPQDVDALLAGPSRIPVPPPEIALGIPAELLRRRPDVRRAEREVAAQSARIGIAESDLYPAFSINGSIFIQANRFTHFFRANAIGGDIGPSFNWNIFNYGRIRNLIAAEEARFMLEVTQYQNVVLEAQRETENAIVTFLMAQEQAATLKKGVEASELSRDLVNELYRGGRADFGRVFFAEYFLVQQQDSLAQAEGAIAQAVVQIYRALGGGWQMRLEPLPPMVETVPAVPVLPDDSSPHLLPPTEEQKTLPEPTARRFSHIGR